MERVTAAKKQKPPVRSAPLPIKPIPVTNNSKNSKELDNLNLVPPSLSTVVGFRGMLLRNEYLKDSSNCLETVKNERDLVDNTVRMGINNPDLVEDPNNHVSDSDSSCPKENINEVQKEADQRLMSRFLQLFLWPAKMSTLHPLKQENIFSDSEDEFMETANSGNAESENVSSPKNCDNDTCEPEVLEF